RSTSTRYASRSPSRTAATMAASSPAVPAMPGRLMAAIGDLHGGAPAEESAGCSAIVATRRAGRNEPLVTDGLVRSARRAVPCPPGPPAAQPCPLPPSVGCGEAPPVPLPPSPLPPPL